MIICIIIIIITIIYIIIVIIIIIVVIFIFIITIIIIIIIIIKVLQAGQCMVCGRPSLERLLPRTVMIHGSLTTTLSNQSDLSWTRTGRIMR